MPEPLGLDLASKKLRKRHDYPYHLSYRTRWADNDMFHHLNNPIYGVLIDSIVNEYLLTHVGYNTTTYPLTALVASSYCDYFAQLQYPGVVELGLRVVRLGRSSVVYEVGFFKEGEEACKAVGGFTQIWVVRETGRVDGEGLGMEVRRGLEGLMGRGERGRL